MSSSRWFSRNGADRISFPIVLSNFTSFRTPHRVTRPSIPISSSFRISPRSDFNLRAPRAFSESAKNEIEPDPPSSRGWNDRSTEVLAEAQVYDIFEEVSVSSLKTYGAVVGRRSAAPETISGRLGDVATKVRAKVWSRSFRRVWRGRGEQFLKGVHLTELTSHVPETLPEP